MVTTGLWKWQQEVFRDLEIFQPGFAKEPAEYSDVLYARGQSAAANDGTYEGGIFLRSQGISAT